MRKTLIALAVLMVILTGLVMAQPLKETSIGCLEITVDGANIEESGDDLVVLRAYKNLVTIDIESSCDQQLEFKIKNLRASSVEVFGLEDYEVLSPTSISFIWSNDIDGHIEFRDEGVGIESFSFIAMGDNRDGPETFQAIMNEVDDEQYAFCVNTGDIVPSGRASQFEEFMGWIEDLSIPFYISIGNHELSNNSADLATSYVGDPDFSFDYGNTHFVVIDNSLSVVRDEQYQWMRDDILSSDKPNLVMVCHVPPYDPREGDSHCLTGDDAEEFKLFAAEMGADLVLNGHIHLYDEEEFYGVEYIITGGAGAPLYATEANGGFFHYVICTIEGDEITHEVVKVTSPLYTPEIAQENKQRAQDKVDHSLDNYDSMQEKIRELEAKGKDVEVLQNNLNRAKTKYDMSMDQLESSIDHFGNEYYRECVTSAQSAYTYAEQGDLIIENLEDDIAEMSKDGGFKNIYLYVGIFVAILAILAAALFKKK